MSKSAQRRPARKTGSRARREIQIKRAYDPPARRDGMRVLIDRLWPRGIAKDELKLDAWTKELAPSNALRKWYGHAPERFAEFARRYRAELAAQADALDELRASARRRTMTLLTATRELELSHPVVLREVLQKRS